MSQIEPNVSFKGMGHQPSTSIFEFSSLAAWRLPQQPPSRTLKLKHPPPLQFSPFFVPSVVAESSIYQFPPTHLYPTTCLFTLLPMQPPPSAKKLQKSQRSHPNMTHQTPGSATPSATPGYGYTGTPGTAMAGGGGVMGSSFLSGATRVGLPSPSTPLGALPGTTTLPAPTQQTVRSVQIIQVPPPRPLDTAARWAACRRAQQRATHRAAPPPLTTKLN